MGDDLLKTPLHDSHAEWGARMVEFAGWSMPVQYIGIHEEHNHTRNSCSMFDVSHMGRLTLHGRDGESFLDHLCTRKLAGAEVGRSYYSHMCREDGGILDDLIVSRFEDHWGIVCNASNRQKILGWLCRHAKGLDIRIQDETFATAMIALQGPKAVELAVQIAPGQDLGSIKRYWFKRFEMMGFPVIVYRSGYTGEDGFEVVVPAGIVKLLLPQLVGSKESPHPVIKPAGLGARDTLRIEAAMPLYGHELTEEVDSLTAGQGWCVDLDKEFIGAPAMRKLEQSGLRPRLVGLELEGRRIARQHFKVFARDRQVGEVTSGTLSPTLGKSIAMAYAAGEFAVEGTELAVELSGKLNPAKVVRLPFYKRAK